MEIEGIQRYESTVDIYDFVDNLLSHRSPVQTLGELWQLVRNRDDRCTGCQYARQCGEITAYFDERYPDEYAPACSWVIDYLVGDMTFEELDKKVGKK